MIRIRCWGAFVLGMVVLTPAGCSHQADGSNEPTELLDGPRITDVNPGLLVNGSLIVVTGNSFITNENGESKLQFRGELDGERTIVSLPARFVDFNQMVVEWPGGKAAGLPSDSGRFVGSVRMDVDSWMDNQRHFSSDFSVELQIVDQLHPRLDRSASRATDEVGYVNDLVTLDGDGFLLRGKEGTTTAIVEGTFSTVDGKDTRPVEPVEIPCVATEPYNRQQVAFPFSPQIAGIQPGFFTGTVRVRNDSPDGAGEEATEPVPFSWVLRRPLVVSRELVPTVPTVKRASEDNSVRVGEYVMDKDQTVSIGQYLIVRGNGFVGGSADGDETTELVLDGSLTFETDQVDGDGSKIPKTIQLAKAPITLVPKFMSGQELRYEVTAHDWSAYVDLMSKHLVYSGQMTPVTKYKGETVTGASPSGFVQAFSPPKQVFWVHFQPLYVESLRHFGLRAADAFIRRRVFEVAARDYAGLNVEFVDDNPEGYALFGQVEVQGPDPNPAGDMFGLDNTTGKDSCNFRLNDTVGGVNPLKLDQNNNAFGGVFVESFFAFSSNPGAFARKIEGLEESLFDQLFDPFRPDRGGLSVSVDELAGIPLLDSSAPNPTAGCPAEDRPHQIACAIWALGSLIGNTVTHESGHTLGLAGPWDCDRVHDEEFGANSDGLLMNNGGLRKFRERVEMGMPPAKFCDSDYQYLRWILPTTDPDPEPDRPACGFSYVLDSSKCGTRTCAGQ